MPRVANQTPIEACSIPAELYVEGSALFSHRWWTIVTKRNAFYIALAKYVTPTTFAKRFKVRSTIDIQTGVEVVNMAKPEKKQRRRTAIPRTPSLSLPTETSEVAEEEMGGDEVGLTREAQEPETLTAEGEEKNRVGRRARRAAVKLRIDKVECDQCREPNSWDKMDLNADSRPVCIKCTDLGEASGEDDTTFEEASLEENTTVEVRNVLVEVPTLQGRPREDSRRNLLARPAPVTIKTESADDDELEVITPSKQVSSQKRKKASEDNRQIVTIQGHQYLIYTDSAGKAKLVKHESRAEKRVKVEDED